MMATSDQPDFKSVSEYINGAKTSEERQLRKRAVYPFIYSAGTKKLSNLLRTSTVPFKEKPNEPR